MANEATNLLASLGVKPKEQRIQEMAGAVTRLVVNEALREAKARAQVRETQILRRRRSKSPRKMGNSI